MLFICCQAAWHGFSHITPLCVEAMETGMPKLIPASWALFDFDCTVYWLGYAATFSDSVIFF